MNIFETHKIKATWSDEAREASALARQKGYHTMGSSTAGHGASILHSMGYKPGARRELPGGGSSRSYKHPSGATASIRYSSGGGSIAMNAPQSHHDEVERQLKELVR